MAERMRCAFANTTRTHHSPCRRCVEATPNWARCPTADHVAEFDTFAGRCILGIETSVGLDPWSTTAFITGLSFAADVRFAGTITPFAAQVLAPWAIALLGISLDLMCWQQWSNARIRFTRVQ